MGRILTLVGADGAGKSTHARKLVQAVVPATYIYMGSNPTATTHSLPTTRAWMWLKRMLGKELHHSGPPERGPVSAPRGGPRRLFQHIKSLGVVALRASEELYRLSLAEVLARRGHLVVLDRHPYLDYYRTRLRAENSGWMRWGDRLHAFLLRRVYPLPEELVLLDAPAEVLYQRKSEGTMEALEARRQEYLDLVEILPRRVHRSVLSVRGTEEEVAATLLRIARDGHRTPEGVGGR